MKLTLTFDETRSPNPAQPLRVRSATVDELPAIYQLELESFSFPWSLEQVRSELASRRSTVLVAIRSTGERAGYLLARCLPWEVEVLKIAVSRKGRRQGVGRALLEELGQRHPAAQQFLEVRSSNDGAIAFYQALGFRRIGLRSAYYANGEDAIVLSRDPARSGAPLKLK